MILHLMIGSYNNLLGELFSFKSKVTLLKLIFEYMIEYTVHSAIFTIQNIQLILHDFLIS